MHFLKNWHSEYVRLGSSLAEKSGDNKQNPRKERQTKKLTEETLKKGAIRYCQSTNIY